MSETVVLDGSGMRRAGEKGTVESFLGRRPGVVAVDANPVSQTATVTYDPTATSVADLRGFVEECGYHCAGRAIPHHVCEPMEGPRPPHAHHAAPPQRVASPHETMGHGGHGAMSMDDMARDMRNRFLVAAVLSIPIVLWSPLLKRLRLPKGPLRVAGAPEPPRPLASPRRRDGRLS
jgi:Cu2+-exporting ATPase